MQIHIVVTVTLLKDFVVCRGPPRCSGSRFGSLCRLGLSAGRYGAAGSHGMYGAPRLRIPSRLVNAGSDQHSADVPLEDGEDLGRRVS